MLCGMFDVIVFRDQLQNNYAITGRQACQATTMVIDNCIDLVTVLDEIICVLLCSTLNNTYYCCATLFSLDQMNH